MGEIETNQLLKQARAGNLPAVEQLLEKYRGRLRRMVACRMDPRVSARVDASDVVQDALIEANQKLPEYLRGVRSRSTAGSAGSRCRSSCVCRKNACRRQTQRET